MLIIYKYKGESVMDKLFKFLDTFCQSVKPLKRYVSDR